MMSHCCMMLNICSLATISWEAWGIAGGEGKSRYSCFDHWTLLTTGRWSVVSDQVVVSCCFFYFPLPILSSQREVHGQRVNGGLRPMICGAPSARSWSSGHAFIFPLSRSLSLSLSLSFPRPPSSLPLFSLLSSFSRLVVNVLHQLAAALWLNQWPRW